MGTRDMQRNEHTRAPAGGALQLHAASTRCGPSSSRRREALHTQPPDSPLLPQPPFTCGMGTRMWSPLSRISAFSSRRTATLAPSAGRQGSSSQQSGRSWHSTLPAGQYLLTPTLPKNRADSWSTSSTRARRQHRC